ncbi:hypothetical protein cyc_05309 [Cyclospora cayetanensis]|uniref:Uncharacterized protein n=1 Tax=Cyclospora cayetanensis TaxID=88456 RepID=A0A1D3CWM6_9EIME|nr:hypothetical protein cyc_05309 [Cyclospora cayetanensis]
MALQVATCETTDLNRISSSSYNSQAFHARLVPLPHGICGAPHPAVVERRADQLSQYISQLKSCSITGKRHDGWIDLDAMPVPTAEASGYIKKENKRESLQAASKHNNGDSDAPVLPGGIFVSRGTLLQRCHTQESNLLDVNGAGVRVQVQLLQQVLSSTIPRQVFEHCYRLGVPEAPDVARALEKKRIQNALRRVKEHLEKLRPSPLDLGCTFEELKTASKPLQSEVPHSCAFSGRDISAESSSGYSAECDSLENYISLGNFIRAMEQLNWWPGELNASDKKETALALALADQIAHPKQRLAARKVLPQGITKRGFVLAFEYLPFNLPEWPLPHDRLPPPGRLPNTKDGGGPLASPQLFRSLSVPIIVSPRQPVSEGHALAAARRTPKDDTDGMSFTVKEEAVLLCQAALLLCLIFGLDIFVAFPGFKVPTSCYSTAAAAAVKPSQKDGAATGKHSSADATTAAERLLSESPLFLKAGEMEPTVYNATLDSRAGHSIRNSSGRGHSVIRQSSSNRRLQQQHSAPISEQSNPIHGRRALVPSWHLAQDYLLSRLVSVEELQAALPCLLSADWVSSALSLVIGTATAVLSPVEWLSLLRPSLGPPTPLNIQEIVGRYNAIRMGLRWNSFSAPPKAQKKKPQQQQQPQAATSKENPLAVVASADDGGAMGSLLGLGCTEKEQQEWAQQQAAQHVLQMANSEKSTKALSRLLAASASGSVCSSSKDAKAVAAAGESFCLDILVVQQCVDTFYTLFKAADIFGDLHKLI